MKKFLLLIIIVGGLLLTCDLFNPIELVEIDRDNQYDVGSEDFAGTITEDADNDGIADISDVDEIKMIYPENDSTIGDATPSLSISPKKDSVILSYCFQVSTDSTFSNNIVNVTENADAILNIEQGLLENQTIYYWRGGVKGLDGTIHWGEVFSFTVDINIGSVSNTIPPDNNIINDTTPYFNWDNTSNTEKYWIQISSLANFDTVIEENNNLTESAYQMKTVLNNESVYYWRVRPFGNEIWGSWSAGSVK